MTRKQQLNGSYYNDDLNGDPPPIVPPVIKPPGDKAFNQADVDRFVAEERRRQQQKNQETIKQLEKLQTDARLTQDERDNFATQLDELKNVALTKEQQLTRDLEKHKVKLDETTKSLSGERDVWQNRFGELLVAQKIIKAASDNDAVSTEQMFDLLKVKSKIVELKDEDGKGSGNYTVLVKFEDTDPKTKAPVTLELDPDAAVKRMRELPDRFGNLFKSNLTGGVGKTKSGAKPGEVDLSKMSPEEYREWRKTRGY